jgi:hypothetical protein
MTVSRRDLQALLPTLSFLALISAFVTFLFLGRLSDSRIPFAASLWVIAYSSATMLHRRFQAQRGRLSRRLFSLGGTESGRLLYVEYVNRRGIDLFLYLLLFATGWFSAVVWLPSIPILSLAYGLTLYVDRKLVPITTSTHPADIFERLWLSLLVLQPVSNLPMVLQWWADFGPSGMIFLAALFWAVQLCLLVSLLHLQWRVDKQSDGPEGNPTKASGP